MCGGDGTVICGKPRVAAECTYTERAVGRCSRPTVRPGRNVNDERDHGDGSDTRPRGRRTRGSLTETRVRDGQYLAGTVRRVGGPDHEPMPAGRDRPIGQDRPRRVRRTRRTGRRRWRSGPGHRRCAPPGLPARWRGGTAVGRGHRGASAMATTPPVLVAEGSWPTSPMIPTWPGWSTVSRPRMGSSHRVREKSPARRPRVVIEKRAQSQPAPGAASGGRWGRLAHQDQSSKPP